MRWYVAAIFILALAVNVNTTTAGEKAGPKDNTPPAGFTALFNGKDLSNWQGLATVPDPDDKKSKKPRSIPAWLVKLPADQLEKVQKQANDKVLPNWKVQDGILYYDGKSNSLQTVK